MPYLRNCFDVKLLMMYLVNFAHGEVYKQAQAIQHDLLQPYVLDIFEYNAEILHEFYIKNWDIIEGSLTGWGYCMWKPYILMDAFVKTSQNDLLFYSDIADEIYNPDFWPWAERTTNQLGGHLFNLNYYIHGEWTKRDCFIVMNCDNQNYWGHRQLEAGTIILRNNPENWKLLMEWYEWCQNPLALDKNPNVLGKPNLPKFMDHRTDQSILTNLVIQRGWDTERMENIRAYIRYNHFDNMLDPEKHLHR